MSALEYNEGSVDLVDSRRAPRLAMQSRFMCGPAAAGCRSTIGS